MVGVQSCLGEGRAVQVVLRVVVDWKREGEAETSKEMTWLTGITDHVHAHKDAATHDILSHNHAFHGRACEKTVLFEMHATGVYSVYTIVELSVLRSGNPNCMLEKIITHCPSSGFEECHLHEFQFCHEEFCHDEDDEDEVCGRFPCCSLYHFHPVFRSTT